MILAFFESVKYVNYMYPVSIIRILFGYVMLQNAFERISSNFLIHPKLAASITEWLPQSSAPLFYREILENFFVGNWKIIAYAIVYAEFIIGFCFIIGFLIRPISILGIIYSIHFIYSHAQPSVDLYVCYLLFFFLTLLIGAGRCLGLDYFFYKRQRGWLW